VIVYQWTECLSLQYVETIRQVPVLIVGAGPSGLNLALALVRRNVPCRLISEADGPGAESRAMVVQARTLEFYGQYGFADEVVEQGVIAETAHVREGGPDGSREVLSISFKEMGAGLSPYPFALAYPQDDHDRFLTDKLKAAGCEVEWGAKLTGFNESGVRATIEHNTGHIEPGMRTPQNCFRCRIASYTSLRTDLLGALPSGRSSCKSFRFDRLSGERLEITAVLWPQPVFPKI
jgi:FAD binding domain